MWINTLLGVSRLYLFEGWLKAVLPHALDERDYNGNELLKEFNCHVINSALERNILF